MNSRGWTWIDEDADHSDYDDGRLEYLAGRWSELHYAEEQRQFARMSDMEEGYDDGPEPEPCEDNEADKVPLRRDNAGERHGMHKLTNSQVIDLVARYNAGESPSALADEYGINRSYPSQLARGARRRL